MRWDTIAPNESELFEAMDATNAAEKIETLENHLVGYNPHYFSFHTPGITEPESAYESSIDAANQAELNIVSDLLELLPTQFTSK
ncbi:MAG: hypothetical protein ACOYN2_03650 [Patescibacteria group bacterium]